jgi:hypothetical protein
MLTDLKATATATRTQLLRDHMPQRKQKEITPCESANQ